MTLTLTLSPETQHQLETLANTYGQGTTDCALPLLEKQIGEVLADPLTLAVQRMTNRSEAEIAQARQKAFATYLPERTPPPGKTLADMVSGKWPGDETDEQIATALKEMS